MNIEYVCIIFLIVLILILVNYYNNLLNNFKIEFPKNNLKCSCKINKNK